MSIDPTTGSPPGRTTAVPSPRSGGPATALLAIADPHVRRAMTEELSYREPWTFLEAGTLTDAAAVAAAHGPGELALVDSSLDGHTDTDELVRLVHTLRQGGWEHVITVGNDARFDRIGAMLSAGARGHLMSTGASASAEPTAAARDEDLTTRRVRVLDSGGQERLLSLREVEVLRLTAEGLGNTEIGDILGLSALTIKSHLARITHRLHAQDRAHLVLLALRAGAIR
ncbi:MULTISPECIES: LuxR C-terminal-related transcriptional regulator [unclassified Pseudonocardia]|jgi:DNA-binding NarL/FixJ family response regulator|uniref:response regulator transcription factor n=1 Tax=unclassified Pseudonocardia TaxID=2619320 RepID=UPI00095F5CC6|nr:MULTISPECIES: LuxR C-terminal-related transcriptional regulator [unclassified Pseudonocardia]MBN9100188.1 response regulator transcription factor [Pseudonocardia sp.]OJY50243.1 MAG: hypothetical protein BGP03_12470 [Pseudonocardia sp. 73-21]